MERALREGREGAHLLDLVAVELDSERLAAGGREDVDEPAADRELAAFLGPLDPLVAGERELLGEPVEAGLGADLEPDRLRPLCRRRHPLGERGRRRADEPAACEHVERARPLADEVRRRLEPGAPAHTAARQQCDPLGADEPAGRVGRVTCVRVLRQQADEPRASCSCSVASSSGRTGSETRARLGRAAANACRRSSASSSLTNAWSTGRSMTRGGNGLPRRFSLRCDDGRATGRVDDRDAARRARGRAGRARGAEARRDRRGDQDRARFGDLSENFEYHDAKNEQGLLERRITILRRRIENAVIVDHAEEGIVGVGSVVEVEDEQGGRFEVEISSVAAASRPTRRSARALDRREGRRHAST